MTLLIKNLFLSVFLLFGTCSSGKHLAKNATAAPTYNDVVLVQSIQTPFSGGAVGSGYGNVYKFEIYIEKPSDFTFSTIWIGEKSYTPTVLRISNERAAPFKKAETIYLEVHANEIPRKDTQTHLDLPAGFENCAALIEVEYTDKKEHIVVEEFKKMKKVIGR